MIQETEVRLLDESGEHVGIVPIAEALSKAQEADLDLVEVGNKSKPHVCRIMNYGQFKYQKAKREKDAKKKQKKIVVKEIKMRPRIDEHDYRFKLDHAKKFFEHGDKVRFILQFRGREMMHKDLGRKVLDRVVNDLEEIAVLEQAPRQEGRFLNMTLAPVVKVHKEVTPKISEEENPPETTGKQPMETAAEPPSEDE